MNTEGANRENHGWTWSHGLHIIYHPRGCGICMEYGQHIMEAKFVRDDEYIVARCQHQEDTDYWRIKADKAQEDLGEANEYAQRLEVCIRELENNAAHHHEYDDSRGGKRVRYNSPYEGGSGLNSPVPPQGAPLAPPPPQQLTDQRASSYAQVVQDTALVHDQGDVQMEEGEVGRFPPLPNLQQRVEPTRGSLVIPCGANWMPAIRGRPTIPRQGGFGGSAPLRLPPLVITSREELEHHLDAASVPGNKLALTCMCAYVRDTQNVLREARSPMQNAALLKWKTPGWVLAVARLPVKGGERNTPAGVNTPRLTDSPKDWVRWMWRYPREAETHPGIQRGRDGMSLSSIRGLLLVTRRAPHGTEILCARNTFIMRAAELMATPGRYRQMVKEMRLTIEATPRATMAQPSENITVEDMARLLAADGITILQVMDVFEWGCLMLMNLASSVDTS